MLGGFGSCVSGIAGDIGIREIASSSTGERVLLGAFEQDVIVYDPQRDSLSPVIHTTFGFGGRRIALSDELDAVVAAAYHFHGLALYACSSGRELWRRKDMKKVQTITLSRDGLSAYCEVADAPLTVVDLRTGETLRRIRACRGLHDSQYDPVQLLEAVQSLALERTGESRIRVSRLTSAVLDVHFAPGKVIVAEQRGAVRSFDVRSGEQLWRYDPPVGAHVLRLGYREQAPCCLAVEWDCISHEPAKLLWLSTEDGSVLRTDTYGRWTSWAFARKGSIAVNEAGMVIDTHAGLRVAQIMF